MENGKKQAFSVALHDNGNALHKEAMGLTKREYFAGLAIQGILASPIDYSISLRIHSKVEIAIKYADELLKQLEDGK